MIKVFCLFNGIDYVMFVKTLYAFFFFNMFDEAISFIEGCNRLGLTDADTIVMDEFLSAIESITTDNLVTLN